MIRDRLIQDVAHYYTAKLREFGPRPAGVDWKDEASQTLRFAQLLQVVGDGGASIVEFGCGYGALLPVLRSSGFTGAFRGIDVAPEMIEIARELHSADIKADFEVGSSPPAPSDYAIASGIFNVRLDYSDKEWTDYVEATIGLMHGASRRGFAFNCLTSYSDPERMRPDLYYAEPCRLFDLCKRYYSPQVALLHDYGLWEFTIVVRKTMVETTAHG